jgi:uncharacterized protein (UPF0335 family)
MPKRTPGGHGTASLAATKLTDFVLEIERLEDEIAALNGQKSEIYKASKVAGFVPKIVKAVVRDRALEPAALKEGQQIYDLYWAAIEAEEARRQADADGVIPDPDPLEESRPPLARARESAKKDMH